MEIQNFVFFYISEENINFASFENYQHIASNLILSSIASERSGWSNEITWPDVVKKGGRALIFIQLKTIK